MLDASSATPRPVEADLTQLGEGAHTGTGDRRPLRRRLRWPIATSLFLQIILVLGDRIPSVDSMSYFETGRNFVNGHGYTRGGAPEMHFPPVAPVGLGLLEKLTGNQMFALRFWELAWGMAAVLLLTTIAWTLSRDDDVVIATAWIATLVPGVVTLAIRAGSGSELPTMVLLLGQALGVLIALDPKADRSALKRTLCLAGAGALVGLAYLTRPEALMPGATIGLAALLFAFRDRKQSILKRCGTAIRYGAAFGFAALLFIAPYLVYTHSNSGSWSMSSKNKDASIDAWRAVAQDDRLERDQILYSIQPDGVSLGPETRSLTAIAKEHPRNWLTIAWINTTTVLGDYLGHPQSDGLTWQLIPLFLTVPALAQIWKAPRERQHPAVHRAHVLAAGHLLLLLRPAAVPPDDHAGAHPVRRLGPGRVDEPAQARAPPHGVVDGRGPAGAVVRGAGVAADAPDLGAGAHRAAGPPWASGSPRTPPRMPAS